MKQRKRRQGRFALPLMFSAATFCVLLVSLLVGGITVYVLARFRLPSDGEVGASQVALLLLLMAFISIVVGTVMSIFVMKLPLKPIELFIAQMNRLAEGDFTARFRFGRPLGDHPDFAEAANSFNKMAEELGNTELLRSDFINSFSHEFKTPIVSIAGFAKLLKRGNLSEEQQREYIDIIEEESLCLAAMATKVLNLSQVENQTILRDVTHYNLSEQLRSSVLLLEEKWSKKELDLELGFGEHMIWAEEDLLKQVWINLLDNAVKFSPRGGMIAVDIMESDTTLQVIISNEGEEISEENLTKIFKKFYQLDASHASGGNGIGLAIVKRVVELHGGGVTAQSKDGRIAFTVTLPKGQI